MDKEIHQITIWVNDLKRGKRYQAGIVSRQLKESYEFELVPGERYVISPLNKFKAPKLRNQVCIFLRPTLPGKRAHENGAPQHPRATVRLVESQEQVTLDCDDLVPENRFPRAS